MDERRTEVDRRFNELDTKVDLLASRSDMQHTVLGGKLDQVISTLHDLRLTLELHMQLPGHQGSIKRLDEYEQHFNRLDAIVAAHSRSWGLLAKISALLIAIAVALLGAWAQGWKWPMLGGG